MDTLDARTAVTDALVDSLGVEPEEVVDDAHLVNDFGMESIDELDVQFKIERRLGIEIEAFSGKLQEAMDGGFLPGTERMISGSAHEQLMRPPLVDRKLDVPYGSLPGTVARVLEVIERERGNA